MLKQPIDKIVGEYGQEQDGALPDGDLVETPSEADETTGASPGTAQACNDLGLNSLENNLKRLGIKPPGVA